MSGSKFICPECREKFKSIGFGFEILATSFPEIEKECFFCMEKGIWKHQMVTCIPVMFMKVIKLERKYP